MLTEWLVIRADGWLDLHENTGKHRQTLHTKLVSGWMSDVSLSLEINSKSPYEATEQRRLAASTHLFFIFLAVSLEVV